MSQFFFFLIFIVGKGQKRHPKTPHLPTVSPSPIKDLYLLLELNADFKMVNVLDVFMKYEVPNSLLSELITVSSFTSLVLKSNSSTLNRSVQNSFRPVPEFIGGSPQCKRSPILILSFRTINMGGYLRPFYPCTSMMCFISCKQWRGHFSFLYLKFLFRNLTYPWYKFWVRFY